LQALCLRSLFIDCIDKIGNLGRLDKSIPEIGVGFSQIKEFIAHIVSLFMDCAYMLCSTLMNPLKGSTGFFRPRFPAPDCLIKSNIDFDLPLDGWRASNQIYFWRYIVTAAKI
jgi:hypothetical protein